MSPAAPVVTAPSAPPTGDGNCGHVSPPPEPPERGHITAPRLPRPRPRPRPPAPSFLFPVPDSQFPAPGLVLHCSSSRVELWGDGCQSQSLPRASAEQPGVRLICGSGGCVVLCRRTNCCERSSSSTKDDFETSSGLIVQCEVQDFLR